MRRKYSNFVLLLVVLLVIFCSGVKTSDTGGSETKPGYSDSEYLIMSVLWCQYSAEYRALCYQGYNQACMILEADLKNSPKDDARAIVVDVDETVLDNSPYQAMLISEGQSYPYMWDQWCNAAVAKPLPGALDFLKYADSAGVSIFYLTNRKSHLKEATIKNLEKVGFPQVTEKKVITRSAESNKGPRREKIEEEYRIILIIGDNLNDFSDLFFDKSYPQRRRTMEQMKDKFGTHFILIPNPMYGAWEAAVYNNQMKIPTHQKRKLRLEALEPYKK
jgi:5'-nucleotidase (lipoprotein e(P4) family)